MIKFSFVPKGSNPGRHLPGAIPPCLIGSVTEIPEANTPMVRQGLLSAFGTILPGIVLASEVRINNAGVEGYVNLGKSPAEPYLFEMTLLSGFRKSIIDQYMAGNPSTQADPPLAETIITTPQ